MEIDKLSSDVLKQSLEQLLTARCKSTGLGETKPTVPIVSRFSTITLKLQTIMSILDKKHGLTDVDKSCISVAAIAHPKAQQRAEAATAHTSSYDDAIKELKVYYEDNWLLFDITMMNSINLTTAIADLNWLKTRINI